jgi:hypothetical protein
VQRLLYSGQLLQASLVHSVGHCCRSKNHAIMRTELPIEPRRDHAPPDLYDSKLLIYIYCSCQQCADFLPAHGPTNIRRSFSGGINGRTCITQKQKKKLRKLVSISSNDGTSERKDRDRRGKELPAS